MHGKASPRWQRSKDLQERYSVSRQTIYAWRRRGILPPPVKIGPNTVGWPPEAIEKFERERTEKTDG